jgi:hypothetical protein
VPFSTGWIDRRLTSHSEINELVKKTSNSYKKVQKYGIKQGGKKRRGGRVQYNIGGVTCNHPLCGREWERVGGKRRHSRVNASVHPVRFPDLYSL